ncbi:hypothetical protein [Klebsiella pneumoniae]|uniref:hypothetical protein n=1 Tax=Klebsiella pneumoniae TaxID=573 RepID=UPI00294A2B7D|nr:hypothetical protein [Klebsiella pneumoniae]MDV5545192.1 hypothetical protein [Klebsiella pneumoniae]
MQQNLHVYDDHAGIIYLADGREVKFDPKLYSGSYQAHSEAEVAKRNRGHWSKRRCGDTRPLRE